MAEAASQPRTRPERRFGAFEGVFVPTTLTILGVILFLRTGWVVGQVGLGGALVVIALAYAISTCTALSMSSIVTNIEIGPGGAFSVITKTLGVELGGSIGVPLYLSQALVAVMYIFSFREGWRWIFPAHPAWAVGVITAAVLFGVALVSARLAFRLQYVILAIIAVSIGSVVAAAFTGGLPARPVWWAGGSVLDTLTGEFWTVFAVFFPAVTGIMAGANMSGELSRPDRAIPRGALAAIGATFLVYVGVAVLLAFLAPQPQLRDNQTILLDVAASGPLVLAGLLAATLSSALSSIVGAPRILQALARRKIPPAAGWLARVSGSGEPRPALFVTGGLLALGIALRDLNDIAELITLFFLLTYGAVNATLLLQQGLGMPSFRPRFRVPLLVPAVGVLGCLGAMVVIDWRFATLATIAVAAVHVALTRRGATGPYGEVRSGLVFQLAAWALGQLGRVPRDRRLAWYARLLVPCCRVDTVRANVPLLDALVGSGGSVTVLHLREQGTDEPTGLGEVLKMTGGTVSRTVAVSGGGDPEGKLLHLLEGLPVALLGPNVLVLPLGDDGGELFGDADPEVFEALVREARDADLGLCLLAARARDPDRDDDEQEQGPPYAGLRVLLPDVTSSWNEVQHREGFSLLVVSAWKLHRAWSLSPRLLGAMAEDQNEGAVRRVLDEALERLRIRDAEREIVQGDLRSVVEQQPADVLLLIGLDEIPSLQTAREIVSAASCDVLFILLSGEAEEAAG